MIYYSVFSSNKPEWKDRVGDSHGGVLIYAKANIHYRRRQDLETRIIRPILQTPNYDHEISKQCGMCDQQRLRPACAYAQSDQSLC